MVESQRRVKGVECVGGALCLLSLAGLEYAQYPQQARHGYTKLGLHVA